MGAGQFEHRETGMEFLDSPNADKSLVCNSHKFMRFTNRFLGGAKIVQDFIEKQTTYLQQGLPLRILDVGAGTCDIAVMVSRWAKLKGLNIKFTCIEQNALAAEMARKNIGKARDCEIELLNTDIFQYKPRQHFHCAVGSLFFHHLSDNQILQLIEHLRGFVSQGILINDLHSSFWTHAGCCLFYSILPPDVRHDVRLSISKGFRPSELNAMLLKISGATIAVKTLLFGRISAVIQFVSGEML